MTARERLHWTGNRDLQLHHGRSPGCHAVAGRQRLPPACRYQQPIRLCAPIQPYEWIRTSRSCCSHVLITRSRTITTSGPNNANGAYPNKEWPLSIFRLFWPTAAQQAHSASDLSSYFQWNDIDFFLLDNRSWREGSGDSADVGQITDRLADPEPEGEQSSFQNDCRRWADPEFYKGFENTARYPAEKESTS